MARRFHWCYIQNPPPLICSGTFHTCSFGEPKANSPRNIWNIIFQLYYNIIFHSIPKKREANGCLIPNSYVAHEILFNSVFSRVLRVVRNWSEFNKNLWFRTIVSVPKETKNNVPHNHDLPFALKTHTGNHGWYKPPLGTRQ